MLIKFFLFPIAVTVFFSTISCWAYEFSLTPQFSAATEYTDNLLLSETDPASDFIQTISSGAKGDFLGETKGATLVYRMTYALYDKFIENDTLRHSANLNLWLQPSKYTRLELTDAFLYTEAPYTEDSTRVQQSRDRYYQNNSSISILNQWGKQDYLNISYAYNILENDASDAADTVNHNPQLRLGYSIFSDLNLISELAYQHAESTLAIENTDQWTGAIIVNRNISRKTQISLYYQHLLNKSQNENSDYQVYNPMVGIAYVISRQLQFSTRCGYFIQEKKENNDDQIEGVLANFNFDYRFLNGEVSLSGEKSINSYAFDEDNFGFGQKYLAEITGQYNIIEGLTVSLSINHNINTFLDLEPVRDDKLTQVQANMVFKPNRWLTIGLEYQYRNQNSNYEDASYEENRGQIMATLSPSTAIPFLH